MFDVECSMLRWKVLDRECVYMLSAHQVHDGGSAIQWYQRADNTNNPVYSIYFFFDCSDMMTQKPTFSMPLSDGKSKCFEMFYLWTKNAVLPKCFAIESWYERRFHCHHERIEWATKLTVWSYWRAYPGITDPVFETKMKLAIQVHN